MFSEMFIVLKIFFNFLFTIFYLFFVSAGTDYNDATDHISGSVERVTYHNPSTGFCVLRVKVQGFRNTVTVVGNTPIASPGEYIKCSGMWYNNREYGRQFKADFITFISPTTLEGIQKFLGSGLIKGIGSVYAKKLTDAFGKDVLNVIETQPDRLSAVDGIGTIRAENICKNWKEQRTIREIMLFLQSHGVGTTRATKIYNAYGRAAIPIVLGNPYRLARDIKGIGFLSADIIAKNLGILPNSSVRAEAGVSHVLLEAATNGHCGLPYEILVKNSRELLGMEPYLIEEAIKTEVQLGRLINTTLDDAPTLFLPSYYTYEKNIAKRLLGLADKEVMWGNVNIPRAISWLQNSLNIELAEKQKVALEKVLTNKVTVITGGPGTGKTTLVNAIIKVLKIKHIRVQLCAPTGRAAKRLSETTGLDASTIHRLLEVDPTNGAFKHNDEFPLDCDFLVVDEMSMVDVPLFNALLKSLPPKISLLLVGDVDQLPSVGAGQILSDIINSKVITTVKLTEIFRQASTSDIITSAHLINKGILPTLQFSRNDSDFYFIEEDNGESIVSNLISLVKDRLPRKFNVHPIHDIQVLCPMQRGGVGVRSLNVELQKALNTNVNKSITKYGETFAIGDKVMQTENDYFKEIYNGDIGIVKRINKKDEQLTINFYNRNVVYEYTELDQVTLAYATTIHKSQGSEYPVVIIPLTMQSYIMLQRNLVYTAITRGKKLVIVIGQRRAFAMAVRNKKTRQRYSKLREWLVSPELHDEVGTTELNFTSVR